MSKISLVVLVFFSVTLSLKNGLGLALNIEISPTTVNELLFKDVEISCQLDNSDIEVKEVMVLEISKEGQAIAIVRLNAELSIAKGMEDKFTAEGRIDPIADKSYLNMTLHHPSKDDAGLYTCRICFLNEMGIPQERIKIADLKVTDEFDRAAFGHLSDIVFKMENTVKEQKKRIMEQEEKSLELEKTVKEQKKQIEEQEEKTLELEKQIEEPEEKNNVAEFFQAVHNGSGVIQQGKILAYGDIVASEGQGYDKASGVFTAPVKGYYFFHISMCLPDKKYIYIDLKTSKGQMLTTIFVGDNMGGWEDYSDGSCVGKLEAGEQVMPVIRSISSSFSMLQRGRVNTFSGHLLKMV